jgi:flagellar biosynthetic protein FlhB
MADENKTHEPTSKKIEDTRKKGNVPKSQEFSGFVILFLGTILFVGILPFFSDYIKSIFVETLQFNDLITISDIDQKSILTIFILFFKKLFFLFFFFGIFIMFFAVLSNVSQFGFLLNKLKIDFKKLNPISGMKNVFSFKKIIEYLKMFIKLIIVLIIFGSILNLFLKELANSTIYSPRALLDTLKDILFFLVGFAFINIVIFAIVDLVFVRYNYFKQLKMSFQEIKDEFKQTEGNPEIKRRIREIQMKTSQGNMMSNVKDSNFVVTNPTHYAVCIKYDQESQQPPMIIAKGIDFLALRIKDEANKNNVPIIENPPLARSLYAAVEVNQPIDEEFYESIIDLLLYVDKLNESN